METVAAEQAIALRRALLAWYHGRSRPLPWRALRGHAVDPYAVLVSEIMLQQTRVQTVLRYFDRWMQRFPDWQALAAANEADVMAAWAGLGYYRRARNLHAAARHVVEHGLPADAAGLRALPGAGAYTAAAVASIVFGEPVAAVDGNAIRVVSRLFDIPLRVDRAPGRRAVLAAADALVPHDGPGDWNQAVMDLGSTLCTPRPQCTECPMEALCAARAAGTAGDRPQTAPKKRPVVEAVEFTLLVHEGHVAVTQRAEGLLAGTWMLPPTLDAWGGGPPITTARAAHAFTHRVWDMQIHVSQPARAMEQFHWVDPARPDVALSTACAKAIAAGLAALQEGRAAPRPVSRPATRG